MLFYIYQYNDLKNFVFDFDSNGRNHLLYDLYILMNDIKVIHNVDSDYSNSIEDIKLKLVNQLYRPVLWASSVLKMKEFGV